MVKAVSSPIGRPNWLIGESPKRGRGPNRKALFSIHDRRRLKEFSPYDATLASLNYDSSVRCDGEFLLYHQPM